MLVITKLVSMAAESGTGSQMNPPPLTLYNCPLFAGRSLSGMLGAADIDRNGEIDWEEFLAATLNNSKLLEEDNIKHVFEVRRG